ncbi:Hsp70 family protein [Faecalicatena contorta]|uniref:Hsp70 family protein n=1 Tax=Faecalicatena contorta TaxID=39482 RepID=UPI001960491F|nr:Hsp70 family protein [Faecalicatena contorta]MBM6686158.1 Hsp70 family protein [Faecalicatena contorta]MBM6711546.1 Hsp70 family protein [Faecalicatena contorta]
MTTPSVVAFTKKGERLVGEAARRQAVTNPDRTISAMVLMQLKEDAEKFLGEPVTEAVITVPVYFNNIQRQATKDAGRIAGLNVKRIINEPTSAAMSYRLNHGEPQKVMVYDLGGDDFDERISQWLVRRFKEETGADLSRDFGAMQRVKDAAEQAKKELSASESAHITLPYLTQHRGEMLHMDLTLTRGQLQELIGDLIERTARPVRGALSDAGIAPAELGRVLLVGGSTRIPAVQEKERMLTGKVPSRNINPDECVAKGAAILGSTLEGNSLVAAGTDKSLLLLDVTPLSLSIETVGGVATRLIERNTTLPTRYSRVFTTAAPYQRSVDIHVLQGERPMARDNKTIGRFRLKGIKAAPAGVPQIEVSFDIDANGILKVSARDLDTGKQQSITITSNDSMSEDEIQQAIRDARDYAGQDQTRKDAVEILGEARKLMAETERKLKEKKKDLDRGTKKQVKGDVNRLNKLTMKCRLDKVTEEQLAEIREAVRQLEESAGCL